MQIMIKPMSVSFQGDVVFAKFLHNYRISNYLCPLFILISFSFVSLFSRKKSHLCNPYKMFIMTTCIYKCNM